MLFSTFLIISPNICVSMSPFFSVNDGYCLPDVSVNTFSSRSNFDIVSKSLPNKGNGCLSEWLCPVVASSKTRHMRCTLPIALQPFVWSLA